MVLTIDKVAGPMDQQHQLQAATIGPEEHAAPAAIDSKQQRLKRALKYTGRYLEEIKRYQLPQHMRPRSRRYIVVHSYNSGVVPAASAASGHNSWQHGYETWGGSQGPWFNCYVKRARYSSGPFSI